MPSAYLRYNYTFCLISDKMCVLSNIAMKMFAYIWTRFVPVAHPFFAKRFVQLNVKFSNVNINFRKLLITFV